MGPYCFLTSASYIAAIKDLYSKCKTPDWHVSSVGMYAVPTLVVRVVSLLICCDGRRQLNISQTCGQLIKEMSHAVNEGSFTSAMFTHVPSWAQDSEISVSKHSKMEQNFPDRLVSKPGMSSRDFKVMACCFGCSHVPKASICRGWGRINILPSFSTKKPYFLSSHCGRMYAFPTIKIDSQWMI